MPLATVRAVSLPSESELRPLYNSAYFVDAFAVTLPAQRVTTYEPDAVARAVFDQSPIWFSLLMWIRDHVMSIFGVKRSTEIRAAAEKKGVQTIAVFPILSYTKDEVILGENDKHLDFQTSFLLREGHFRGANNKDSDRQIREAVVTTVVHCHGLFGKAYITVIKPFHVLFVKYALARVPDKITATKH
jgi:hypothetical protein